MAQNALRSQIPQWLGSRSLIAPSILSSNFADLAGEIADVEKAGADWIHVDVMDGHFVPNLTLGPPIVKAIRPLTKLPLDCHLMVARPDDWLDAFAKAGADVITIHAEAAVHLNRSLAKIKDLGCLAGVSINPATSLASIEEVLEEVDLVLLMSVNPGFGGQKFISKCLEKIEKLKELRAHSKFLIEVDGGIHKGNIGAIGKAGCDVFVAGSAIFSQSDRASAIAEMRKELKS